MSTEPRPDSLDEPVDWMTYSHPELYRMVHEGLDLTGAVAVSADWARMGEALGEIGDELSGIVAAFAQAWEGDAAGQAQHAVGSLAAWAHETGTRAMSVSGCITVEVDNATHARNTMPPPVQPGGNPGPVPRDVPTATDATAAASAFTGGGFAAAEALIADQNAIIGQAREAHQRAAETMQHFQAESREVYHTVPRFVPPQIGRKPLEQDEPPVPPVPAEQPTPPAQVPDGGGRVPSAGPPPVGSAPDPAPAPGPRLVPAPVGSVGPPGPVAGSGEPAAETKPAASQSPRGAGTPMAGMPMGGAGGARGTEDLERKSRGYVKEDESVWGLADQHVAPPVIGEERGRA